MKKLLISIATALILLVVLAVPAMAATEQDVTITATPAFVSISNTPTSYGFGTVQTSSTPSTITTYFSVDNTSSVSINCTVSVTTSTWSGGVTWAHSDTATPGADTAGLKVNVGGTWGTGDIIVKYSSPNNIVTGQAANTDWQWGIKLWAPTSFGDGVQKQIIVRLTASAA